MIIIAAESDRQKQHGKEISLLEWQRSAQSDPLITRLLSRQALKLGESNTTKITSWFLEAFLWFDDIQVCSQTHCINKQICNPFYKSATSSHLYPFKQLNINNIFEKRTVT